MPASKSPMQCGAWVRFARAKAIKARRIPTKTCSPSCICLAAQTTISSWGVYSIKRLLNANAFALDPFRFGMYTFPPGAPGAVSFHDPLEGAEIRVLKLKSVIDGCRVAMLFDAQATYAFLAELLH